MAQEGWTSEQIKQHVAPGCIEFRAGDTYSFLKPFQHSTEKDEKRSKEKGKEVWKMQALTLPELQAKEWALVPARRSAIVYMLLDTTDASSVSADALFADRLAAFLRRNGENKSGTPLRVLITGPVESTAPGVQQRVQRIFALALGGL